MKTSCRFLSAVWLVIATSIFLPTSGFATAAPSITTQPQSQSVLAGTDAIFSVEASGQGTLFYQWSFNGTNLTNSSHISGATAATLTINTVIAQDGGNYRVTVGNSHGSVTSSVAALTVLLPPCVSTQLRPQTVRFGQNVLLAVAVTGSQPITFRWYQNGMALSDDARHSGSGTSALTISSPQLSDTGDYLLVASNAFGTTTSALARITVIVPGSIVVWGDNTYGEASVPAQLNNSVALAAGGYHSVAVAEDGSVAAWGENSWGQTNVPAGLSNVIAVAAGHAHSLALKADGTVIGWGYNYYGQTNVPAGLSNVVAIAAGGYHSLALQADGRVVAWGDNSAGQTDVPSGLSNVVSIAAGYVDSLALRADGTLVFWGSVFAGQTNLPPDLTNVVAIACGVSHCLALKADTTVEAWGLDSDGQTNVPSGLSNVIAVACGEYHCLALKSDGTVVAWGGTGNGQTNVPAGLKNVVAISGGEYHSMALVNGGPPSITQQPADSVAQLGASAIFSVVANGTGPLSYQWKFDGTNLTAATNSVLRLNNLQPSQAGNYAVTVSNIVGAVTSSNATLTVNLPPPGVPFITGFTPGAAFPGTTVLIWGTNFSSIAASNIVYFGAVRATVIAASETNLSVVVPVGATYAPISVTVSGFTAWANASFEASFPGGGTLNSSVLAPRVNLGTGNVPFPVAIGDLDGDGKPDLVVGNTYDATIWVYRNISTNPAAAGLTAGSFAPPVILVTGGGAPGPNGLALADLDGDGRLDIAVANYGNGTVSIFQNLCLPGSISTNSFGARVDFWAGQSVSVAVRDLDGDGRPEIVAAFPGINSVAVLKNLCTLGTITTNSFAAPVFFTTAAGSYSVAIADLDGDGKPDLVTANQSDSNSVVSVLRNVSTPGNVAFAHVIELPSGFGQSEAKTMVVGDLDGDGKPDLVIGSYWGQTVSVYRNQSLPGNIGTNSFVPAVALDAGGRIHQDGIAIADLDGDGKEDLAVTTLSPSKLSLYRNLSGTGGILFGPRLDFPAGNNASAVAIGDLNGDERPDIVVANAYYDNTISIYQNLSPFSGPPVIIALPANLTVPLDNVATLTATVIGQTPLNYQWYFNGMPLTNDARVSGSTTASLSISDAQLADSGSYFVIATNSLGSVTSAVATLTVVILPPVFQQQPQDQTDVLGSNAVFSATVAGSQPMTLQWFGDNGLVSDDSRISGSTTAALTIAGVQTNDAVSYWLVASNAANVATSAVAYLTVLVPPTFIQQPTNQSVIVGSNVSFVAEADGTFPLSYRWYFNGAPLSDDSRITGSMTSTLSISNVQASDDGNYGVVVSNAVTSVTSVNGTLTVWVPPSVTIQPIGRSIPLGLSTTFNVAASGSTSAYQWQLNGANIPSATNASYTIAAVGTNDLGIYQCVVSNAVGIAVSSNALLTIGPVAAWGNNYYNQCLPPPGLSNVVSIAGGGTYSLASLQDGSIVAWGNADTYTNSGFTNVVAVSSGTYGALALRADGTVAGSSQLNPLSYNIFPSNIVAVAAGMFHALALREEGTVVAWGGGNYPAAAMVPRGLNHITAISAGYAHSLALRSDGRVAAWGYGPAANVPVGVSNVIAMAAGNTFSLALKSDGTVVAWGAGPGTNVPAGLSNVVAISTPSYYSAAGSSPSAGFALKSDGTVVAWGSSPYLQTLVPWRLSNVVAVAGSSYHTLALVNNGMPLIVREPVGGTAFSGNAIALNARVAGQTPLTYSWSRNGTNIAGATNAMFVISNAQATDIGTYQLTASNDLGVAVSIPVPVTVVDSAPFILSSPTNCIVYFGQPLQIESVIAGSTPMQLQWVYNGTKILNATNSDLIIPWGSFSPGTYELVASNAFGSLTSSNIVVTTTGPVIAWGGNQPSDYGAATNVPAGASNAVAIAAGSYDNLALKADGTVIGWGMFGGLTNVPPGLSNVVEIAAGSSCSLALKKDGTVTGWGYGHNYSDSNAVQTLSNIVSIEADSLGSTFLRADGSLARLTGGSFTYPSSASNIVLLAPLAGGHYAALRADGTIYPHTNSIPPDAGFPTWMTNKTVLVFATSQGQVHGGMYLRRDRSVYDWGTPQMPATAGSILDVACSGQSKLVLRTDGSIAVSGSDTATNVPLGLTGAAVIDAGYQFGIALFTKHGPSEVFLPDALNTSLLVVSSKGSPRWFGQTEVTHDGVSAAQSAEIGNNTASSMRLWVVGPVTASFWWKVSSATNHGVLSFSAGGTVLTNISGETGWRPCTVSVPPGNQILQWTYSKDGTAAAGQDAGWVDQLQLTPVAPAIATEPASQNVVGPTNVVLNVTATGTPPLTYHWWKDGSQLPREKASSLTLVNAVRTNSGTYWVVVTNIAGNAISSNAVVVIRVPQLLRAPTVQPDGSVLLSSTDISGGQLSTTDLTNLQAQVSTNLVDWTVLSNALVLSNGVVRLQDLKATNSPVRFYRILENW